MRWRMIVALIFTYAVYLFVGAAVFYALEFSNEEALCKESIEKLAKYNITTKKSSDNITTGSIREFVQLILSAVENGVQFDSDVNVRCAHNWNYHNAFFFAGTVITTIGYGNIYPKTSSGQIFCILYAIIGLPLFGLMFSGIGAKFAALLKRFDKRMRRKGRRTIVRKCFVILATVLILVVFCILIPSAIFVTMENWTYEEAVYYSFITLTTIGFGDYVVGLNSDQSYASIYRIGVYVWILFGLSFMAAVVSLTGDLIKEKANRRNEVDTDASSDEETENRRKNEDNLKENERNLSSPKLMQKQEG